MLEKLVLWSTKLARKTLLNYREKNNTILQLKKDLAWKFNVFC